MKKASSHQLLKTAAFFTAIFVLVFVFYTKIHPLYVYDTDDWFNIFNIRPVWPIWHGLNPAKVFPEIFMPVSFEVSMAIVYPFVGDITVSFCVFTALITALLLSAYVYSFFLLIKNRFHLSLGVSQCLALLFFVLHFLIYRSSNLASNGYAFYAYDVTCYYHYIFPSVMNATFVLMLIAKDCLHGLLDRLDGLRGGMLLLLVYLLIFSNLYSSVILSIYVFVDMVFSIQRGTKSLREIVREHSFSICILLLWGVALLFDANGGRSEYKTVYGNVLIPIVETGKQLYLHFIGINKLFYALGVVAIISAFVYVKRDDTFAKLLKLVFPSLFLVLIYYSLLSSVVNPQYVRRTDAMFGFSFYVILLICLSISFVVKQRRKLGIMLPLLILLVAIQSNTKCRTYKGISIFAPERIVSMNNKFIGDIVRADKKGINNITIQVPNMHTPTNWPFDEKHGNCLSAVLLKHGIIHNEVKVNIVIENR